MLARRIEAAGIATVVVTMMPETAERLAVARIVGVEFPYGHPFGLPGEPAMQRRVLLTALTVLAGATAPTTRVDLDIEWPVPLREAYRSWQPAEPSPLVAALLRERAAAATRPAG